MEETSHIGRLTEREATRSRFQDEASMTAIATAKIWMSSKDRLTDMVEKINRRAKRLGVAPFVLSFEGEFPVHRIGADGIGPGHLVGTKTQATISGERIMLGGWTLAAKFDFMGDAGCIVSKAPGFETLDVDREISPTRCDHCRTARRRAVSYLVQNESGARKVVGSSCLPDFTGMGRTAEHMLALADACRELLDGDEDEGYLGGGRMRGESMSLLLAATAAMIRCYGWMSRKTAQIEGKSSTSDAAVGYINADEQRRRKFWPKLEAITRTDFAVAKRAMHWAGQQSGNDYLDNLAVLAKQMWCIKHTGLACSMVAAWQRHRGELMMQARRAAVNPDVVLGQPGEKIWASVEVIRRVEINTDFGLSTLITMIDVMTGATVFWKASGDCEDLPVGAHVQITATVKKLDSYKGVRQTVVTRANVLVHWVAPRKPTKKEREAQAAQEKEESKRRTAVYYRIDPDAADRDEQLARLGVA